MNKKEFAKSTYRADIQGIRAIAVLLVVIYHSGLDFFPGGYIGVDVFFVISGFLITGMLVKEQERFGTIDLFQFYARRIRRLLPASFFVVIITILVAWHLYSPLELKIFSSSAFATSVYLSNLWFAHLSTDYLAEDTETNPLLHTWSLSVEEQFYLFWPILIFFLLRNSTVSVFSEKKLFRGLMILTIISFFTSVFLTKYNQPWAFFSPLTRAWEFGVGGIIALIPLSSRYFRLSSFKSGIFSFIGLMFILVAACVYDERVQFPGIAAVIPVIGTALLIGAGHTTQLIGINRLLGIKPLQFIGNISYSLYLWHWPVFLFLPFLYPNLVNEYQWAGIAFSFILAWITVKVIENPFRYSQLFAKNAWFSIAFGILLSIISACFSLGIRQVSILGMDSPRQKSYLAAKNDLPIIRDKGCHIKFLQTDFSECIFGSPNATKTIVLFGDSHAAHWFPALEKISQQYNWRLISLTKTGCPSISFEPFNFHLNRAYTECTEWREKVFKRIENLKPNITILANSSRYLTEYKEESASQKFELWQQGVKDTFLRLDESSSVTVVIRDTPWLDFSAPTCLSRADWQGKDLSETCSFGTTDEVSNKLFKLEQKELTMLGNNLMIDMTSAICPAQKCSVERNGLILFADANHLTASFSRSLSDVLYSKLKSVL